MSRRKQLHPKPIKDCGKDDVEQVCRSHNLPNHILHLQELTDDPELDYRVLSISTILQGSQFGPFNCTVLEAEEEGHDEEGSCILEFPISTNPAGKVCLSIESPSGHWLRLLRRNSELQSSNVKLHIQDKSTVWCEVVKNILPDEELVATLLQDDKTQQSSSSSSSSSLSSSTSSFLSSLPSSSSSSSSTSSSSLSTAVVGSSSIKQENADVSHITSPSSSGTTTTLHSDAAISPSIGSNIGSVSSSSVHWENNSNSFRRRERKLSGLFETAETETERQRPTFSLIHVCMFCGVRFSNPRTLQAHIANYCSKKPADHRVVLPANPSSAPFTSPTAESTGSFMNKKSAWHNTSPDHSEGKSHKRSFEEEEVVVRSASKILCKTEKETEPMECDDKGFEEKDSKSFRRTSETSEPEVSPGLPCIKSDGISSDAAFPCPHCPYSFESSLLLTHHLRIHYLNPPESSPGVERQTSNSDEYLCSSCNIRFSSMNTYKGHKEFYCQKRNRSSIKTKNTASPEPTANENTISISPLYPLPPSRLPLFSPGSAVFPPPIFPPPCLQPANGLYVSQAQAVLLAASPFLGSSSMPNMAFNVPIVVQPIAPLLTNGILHGGDYHINDAPKIPAIKQEAATTPSTIRKNKFGSESGDEKPLDLSTRKSSPIVKEKPHHAHGKKDKSPAPKQALSDNEQRSNSSPDFGRSPTLSNIKVCSPNYLPDSIIPVPPPSLIPSPFAITNMLSMGSSLSPCNSDLALPSAMATPSVSKCVDCNIVFYKHENYIAHKEHYCAGRFSKLPGVGTSGFVRRPLLQSLSTITSDNRSLMTNVGSLVQSPGMKPTADSLSSISGVNLTPESPGSLIKSSSQSPELVATIDQGTLQYYCIPCKIKFSSLDTLKAHKKFYCPSKSTNPVDEQPSATKTEENCNGSRGRDSSEVIMMACSACGNSFASPQLLKLHYCTGTMVHYPLFHCPYCDYIAQSDSRLVDHIKAHAPSKAYKCVLCGYRGNTVRGMRMHGKMHNDAGETFTDDSMIEYEEPPMIPKRLRSTGEGTFGEMEVDLIRLKNEPYKRRRSRKAYEKSEFCQGPAPTRCVECKEMFSDSDLFQAHMQTHVAEKIRAWKSCDLNPNSTADLLQLQAKLYPGSVRHLNQTTDDRSCSDVEQKQNHTVVKDHRACPPLPVTYSAEEDFDERNSSSASREEQEEVDVVDTSCGPTENETDGESHCPQTNNNHKDSNDANLKLLPTTVKEEIVDTELSNSENATQVLSTQEDVANDTLSAEQVNGEPESNLSSELTDNGNLEKYCKQCNITFMYTSTFIAHKKYYCSSHTAERSTGPTVA